MHLSGHLKCACAETAGLYKDRRQHLQQLAALFGQRPIWSKPAICARFPGVPPGEFDIMLPRLAYIFRNGSRSCMPRVPD